MVTLQTYSDIPCLNQDELLVYVAMILKLIVKTLLEKSPPIYDLLVNSDFLFFFVVVPGI